MKKIFTSLIALLLLATLAACTKTKVNVTFIVDGINYKIDEVTKGETAFRPADPSKIGHEFDGWYQASDFSGEKFIFITIIEADLKLYGKQAEIEKVMVSFISNGGSPVNAISVSKGGTISEPVAPIKGQETFAGWFTDVLLTVKFDFSSKIDANLELFAKWELDVKKIGTALDLKDFFSIEGETKDSYELTNDIDMTGIELGSSKVDFHGIFDGKGHTISNITASATNNKEGLMFRKIFTGAIVRNFKLKEVSSAGVGEGHGIISQYVFGGATIQNIEFENVTIKNDSGNYTGLIYADNNNDPTVYNPVTIKDIVVRNNPLNSVSGNQYVGGLVGYIRISETKINFENIYFESNIISKDTGVGALVARIAGARVEINATNVVIKGEFSALSRAGGIIGNVANGTMVNLDRVLINKALIKISENTTVGDILALIPERFSQFKIHL